MTNSYGPILIFLGILFLIAGLIYLIMLRREKKKYPSEAWATVSYCRKYKLKKGSDTYVYHALILNFVADDKKSYEVRRDVGRICRPYSKNDKPYAVDDQLKVHYHPENPQAIDLDVNNSRRMTFIMSRVFIYASLACLFIGSCMTFYYD